MCKKKKDNYNDKLVVSITGVLPPKPLLAHEHENNM